jgi:hypothetical protein
MTTTAVPTSKRRRRVSVLVTYGGADVERAAESLNVPLSDEEVGAILADVDGELSGLAASATRSALTSRIYEDLAQVARGHAWSDDE